MPLQLLTKLVQAKGARLATGARAVRLAMAPGMAVAPANFRAGAEAGGCGEEAVEGWAKGRAGASALASQAAGVGHQAPWDLGAMGHPPGAAILLGRTLGGRGRRLWVDLHGDSCHHHRGRRHQAYHRTSSARLTMNSTALRGTTVALRPCPCPGTSRRLPTCLSHLPGECRPSTTGPLCLPTATPTPTARTQEAMAVRRGSTTGHPEAGRAEGTTPHLLASAACLPSSLSTSSCWSRWMSPVRSSPRSAMPSTSTGTSR